MKKETTNTFKDGMVKDLHPLTTPNSVLTDALNATLLTYNGNELILQNDMGNVEVGTAKLPPGYVPVGMKEHGGIIYVAAWNPETKKGQVGSFPSPRQLWEGEDWSVNSDGVPIAEVSFNTREFYVGNFITTENVKKGLFNFSDGTYREFHPGDRFAIALNQETNDRLKSYVDSGKIDIYIGVVRKDGSIEIMQKASDGWFFLVGNSNSYINTKQSKVFTASSSGRLLLIVNIITLDSFDLIREYSLIDNNTVNVRFTGKGTLDGETYMSTSSKFDLYNSVTDSSGGVINLIGSSGKQTYEIYPELDYGRIYRMKKRGTIDFIKIRKYQENFHEWRYFVDKNYIKLGWAYEFYNLDNNKSIDYIQLDFYDYLRPSSYPNDPRTTIELSKDFYSGNFEDIIRFDEHPELRKKHIYIVRFARKMKDGEFHVITHKMIYLTPLYNSQYNSIYKDAAEDADIIEFQRTGDREIQLSYSPELDFDENNEVSVTITNPQGDVSTPNIWDITKEDYIIKEPNVTAFDNYKQFTTIVRKNLSGKVKFNTEVNYDSDLIIGKPNDSAIQNAFSNNITINNVSVNRDKVDWTGSSSNLLFHYDVEELPNGTVNKTTEDGKPVIRVTGLRDYRVLQGKAAPVKTKSYTEDSYVPFFSELKGSIEDKMKTCTFYDQDVRCVGMSKDEGGSTLVNVALVPGTGGELKDVNQMISGVTADQAALDAAMMKMGRPTVSIMTGIDGAKGSLRFMDHNRDDGHVCKVFARPIYFNGWTVSDGHKINGNFFEVDNNKDYLIAVWKFDNEKHYLVNLMTSKRFDTSRNASMCPRLDVMLRCFMSQIFLPGKVSKTINYTYPNNAQYRYETGNSDIQFEMNLSPISINDAMMPDWSDNSEIDESVKNITLYNIFNAKWTERLPQDHGVVNIIPKVYLYANEDTEPKFFEVNDDYGLEDLLQYYLQDSYDFDIKDSGIDPQSFKIVDVTKSAQNAEASVYKDGNKPIPSIDGTFEWKTTPALTDPMDYANSPAGDVLYTWKGEASWQMYYPLKSMFRTRAEYEGWDQIGGPNGEAFNELLGRSIQLNRNGDVDCYQNTLGQWVEGTPDTDAPHPRLLILYSNWSLYSLQ